MRVTCNLCEFEVSGACTKKRQNGTPKKVQLTKRRTCPLFKEDAMKVFSQFRNKEKHRANLRRQEMRSAKLAAAISQLKNDGLTSVTKGGKDVK